MHAIVSLLDEAHYRRVEEIWAELDRRFGLRGAYGTPFPHVTYQVAQGYDLDRLEPLLHQVAQRCRPFRIQTGGIGVFTGPAPVLYLPVARSAALARCHQAVWVAATSCGTGLVGYYEAHRWLPHITLGERDISLDLLPQVVGYLNTLSLDWDVEVDNLALIWHTGTRQELRLRLPLGL
ncbi:MAG: 2'-5' RNA ligase family protein [Bacillota bacterium]